MNDQGEWDGWTGSCYYELYNEITLFNVAFFPSLCQPGFGLKNGSLGDHIKWKEI